MAAVQPQAFIAIAADKGPRACNTLEITWSHSAAGAIAAFAVGFPQAFGHDGTSTATSSPHIGQKKFDAVIRAITRAGVHSQEVPTMTSYSGLPIDDFPRIIRICADICGARDTYVDCIFHKFYTARTEATRVESAQSSCRDPAAHGSPIDFSKPTCFVVDIKTMSVKSIPIRPRG